jgi:gluconate 2-dehydrogenase gamma chain
VSHRDLSRRRFLKQTGLYGGGLLLAWQLPRPLTAEAAAASTEPVSLSALEWANLDAIVARIIPSDAEPGAREAGCVNFIDKALDNEDAAALPLYRAGLAGVEAAGRDLGEGGFARADSEAQDKLLGALQAGTAPGWSKEAGDSAFFFETVRQHTIAGFLADPSYGGNRDMVGWKVAGYPGPRHRRGGYSNDQVVGKASIISAWGEEL